jgi:hypothetical protein
MALPYREFGTWVLSDLAERSATEHSDRVIFRGNHISHHFMLPVETEMETAEEYSTRLEQFRKRLPRGSDLSRRLALATEAFVRAGEKDWSAANLVSEERARSSSFCTWAVIQAESICRLNPRPRSLSWRCCSLAA